MAPPACYITYPSFTKYGGKDSKNLAIRTVRDRRATALKSAPAWWMSNSFDSRVKGGFVGNLSAITSVEVGRRKKNGARVERYRSTESQKLPERVNSYPYTSKIMEFYLAEKVDRSSQDLIHYTLYGVCASIRLYGNEKAEKLGMAILWRDQGEQAKEWYVNPNMVKACPEMIERPP